MALYTRPPISIDTIEVLDSRRVSEDLQTRLESRPPLKRLNQEALRLGYVPLVGPQFAVGYRNTVKSTSEIKAPRVIPGEPRAASEVQFEILGHSLGSPASRALGAIVSTTLTTGEAAITYDFLLDAKDGNFERATEWVVAPTAGLAADAQAIERPAGSYIDMPAGSMGMGEASIIQGDGIIEAESWWSGFVGCLRSRCASSCLSSLHSCSGYWAAYFWCLVAKCGGCVLKCAACSTCDCRWWCRWAVGCCDR